MRKIQILVRVVDIFFTGMMRSQDLDPAWDAGHPIANSGVLYQSKFDLDYLATRRLHLGRCKTCALWRGPVDRSDLVGCSPPGPKDCGAFSRSSPEHHAQVGLPFQQTPHA